MPIEFLVLVGRCFFLEGGGSANFISMGAVIFLGGTF